MTKEYYDSCQECMEYKRIYVMKPRMICKTCYNRLYQQQYAERVDNSVFIATFERNKKNKAILKAIDSGMSDAEIAFHFKCSRQYSHKFRKKHLRDNAGYGK